MPNVHLLCCSLYKLFVHVKFQAFCSIPSAIEEEAGKTKIHQNGFVLSLLMLVPLTKSIIQEPLGKMSIFLILVFIVELHRVEMIDLNCLLPYWNYDIDTVFENHRKKYHSTLRAKRATFTF